ncbi:MAG: hypothetical protein OXD01_13105 [Gammaproteobacteria bacterium]|nr:hypothetical protein [Gammaproteobacteria bacterium]
MSNKPDGSVTSSTTSRHKTLQSLVSAFLCERRIAKYLELKMFFSTVFSEFTLALMNLELTQLPYSIALVLDPGLEM